MLCETLTLLRDSRILVTAPWWCRSSPHVSYMVRATCTVCYKMFCPQSKRRWSLVKGYGLPWMVSDYWRHGLQASWLCWASVDKNS